MVSRRAQVVLGLAVLARVCVRRDVGGAVLYEDRAPSGRDLSAAHKGDCRSVDPRAGVAQHAGNRRQRRRGHVHGRPVIEVFTTRPGVRCPEDARRRPCRDRRHGDDRGALGDAPLPATCPHRRLDRPCGRRDGNAGGEGHERSERLCALEQPRLRRGQRGKHRGSRSSSLARLRTEASTLPTSSPRSPTTRRSTSRGARTRSTLRSR